jgi:hypothetical protein
VIAQVKELITSGEGSAGEIVQLVTLAPLFVTVGVIVRAVPTEPE